MARRIERPPTRHARDHPPSFSSSLLDAIYRSIDESDARGAPDLTKRTHLPSANPVTDKPVTASRSQQRESSATAPVSQTSAPREVRYRSADAVSHKMVTGPRRGATVRCTGPAVCGKAVTRSRLRYPESTSSSSDASSYNGFSSSSDADSSARPTRLGPIRTGLAPLRNESRSDPMVDKKKGKPGSVLSRLKPPVSPGARLASFLNSLFSAAAGNSKKPRSSATAGSTEDPAAAQSLGKRSMVSVGCAAAAAARGREARRTVEEMLRRRFAREMGFEDDDVASDASSDLFELENLTVSGTRYRDELPVYGSTNLKADRGVVRRCTPLREETKGQ